MLESEPQRPAESIAAPRSLREALAELDYALPPEDVIHLMVGLMREVATLHERGEVADLTLSSIQETSDG